MSAKDYEITEQGNKICDSRKEISLTAAACILLDFPPYRNNYPESSKADIKHAEQRLKEAIKEGEIEETSAGPKVSMSSLKTWAERNDFRPKSLFPDKRERRFKHSDDFRSVTLNDEIFSLTYQQAQVVEILYEAYKNGPSELGQEHILGRLGTSTSRLIDTFKYQDKKTGKKKTSKAWKILIVSGGTKGSVRLNI